MTIDPAGLEPTGFAASIYLEQAALAREGLELLKGAAPERRAVLEEAAAPYDFLAVKLPAVLEGWRAQRDSRLAPEPPHRNQ